MSTTLELIAIKSGTDIHVSLRIINTNFGDPLTFHQAPPSGPNLNVSSTFVYNKIPAELVTLTLTSASALLCEHC